MNNIYNYNTQHNTRPLNKAEQIQLYSKMKNGDNDARNTVIASCFPLVINIAKKFRYNNKHIDIEDMIQEGNIALINAVNSWNVNKGNITTVATWCIRNRLIDMINDSRYTIRYPYSISRRAAEELRRINNIDSTDVSYISKETGLSSQRVQKLLSVSTRHTKRVKLDRDVNKVLNEIKEEETANSKPCLGDLIDLINTYLTESQKNIFCLWAGIYKKRMGPKEIAYSLGKTEKYVYDNIYSAKRVLSRAAKKVNYNA